MTSSNSSKLRSKMLRDQLASIDERYLERPMSHPFSAQIEIGFGSFDELFTLIKNDNTDIATRALAIQALGVILKSQGQDPVATSLLIHYATEKNGPQLLRTEAGKALLVAENPDFIEAFLSRLGNANPAIAEAAAHAMGVARCHRAIEPLIELFAKSDAITVQSEAAWALGEIGDERALEILEASFMSERCLIPVIVALGKMGNEATMGLLTIALRDTDFSIRLSASEAIYAILERYNGNNHGGLYSYLEAALTVEKEPKVAVVLIACIRQLGHIPPKALLQRSLATGSRRRPLQSFTKKHAP
ncbi:MAG: HEAT repeat domain-containing protein [Myxococcota bacterium]|nr:HEAT repeat domain-containing protein [Myxococcota bacterium]